jgi:hypothetical protein
MLDYNGVSSGENNFVETVDSGRLDRRTSEEQTNTMQFLLLIYDQEARWTALKPEEYGAESLEFGAFGKEFAGTIKSGNALQPTSTAKTVRVRDGKSIVTDGPFAETKEQLGGYYLVEARDAAEAAAIGAKIPWARFGSIEVRPILTFS